jgi:hypothetical protein
VNAHYLPRPRMTWKRTVVEEAGKSGKHGRKLRAVAQNSVCWHCFVLRRGVTGIDDWLWLFTKHSDNEIKEVGVYGGCSTNETWDIYTNVLAIKSERRDHSEHVGIYVRIILKWILKKLCGIVAAAFRSLMKGPLAERHWWTFEFHGSRGISWLNERQL